MKTFDTGQLLENLERQTAQHLKQAETVYRYLSAELLNKPSAVGGWSIAQCLSHLNSYSAHYLPRTERALRKAQPPISATFTRGWLGNYFINMMDPDVNKARYSAMKKHVPPVNLPAGQILDQFIAWQSELLSYLQQAKEKNLDTTRVSTSISPLIRMKLGDTLQFIVMHNERHIRQANRNLIR
ncbi:DinB family protein [Pedobacter sp. SYP-B3415]|uniref:DinB family protein n=1 Tax=Pedobacter sp. SYP-B3415 TaxID=2496641 RepID=UPI00101DF2B7|nr:DinB family protein [Pedobacter sp. SYP-B3415]